MNSWQTLVRLLVATGVLNGLAIVAGKLAGPALAGATRSSQWSPWSITAVLIVLALAAAGWVGRTWLERSIWLAPCALATMGAGCITLFVVALCDVRDDKTIIGLIMGVMLLVLAVVLGGAIVGVTHLVRRRASVQP